MRIQPGASRSRTRCSPAWRAHIHTLAREAKAALSPRSDQLDLARLDRTFTIRANEGFIGLFAPALVTTVNREAPRVRVRFAPKPAKEAGPLRDGEIDLEIDVAGDTAPELRTRFLFRDHFIGAVRAGHPLLANPITAERYAACDHVVVSRKGKALGPVDEALALQGLTRTTVAVVPGFLDALRIAQQSDLVALAPRSCLGGGSTDAAPLIEGLAPFALPLATPEIVVWALWHPRMDADPAHRWLRDTFTALIRPER